MKNSQSSQRKFSRRHFLRGMAVTVGGAALTACVPAAPATTTAPQATTAAAAPAAAAPSKQKKPIIYWSMFGLDEAKQAQAQVDRFNEETGESALFMSIGWGNITQKVQIAIEGGNPPDIVSLWQEAYTWGPRGLLLPLEDLAKADGWAGQGWTKAAYEQLSSDGHLWGTGHTLNMAALHVNRTQYEEAGYSVDAPPQRIVELDAMGEKLTKKADGGGLTRLGFLPWQGTDFFHWAWAHGGEFYDKANDKITCGSDEKILAAMKWYKSYADKYGIDNIDKFRSGFGQAHFSPDDPWYVGKVTMQIDGSFKRSWIPRYAPDMKYFVAKSPTVEGVPPVSVVAIGAMFNVPKGAQNPEGGWKLAKEFASKRCQIEFNKAVGNLPPLEEAAKDPEYINALPYANVFIEMAATGGRAYPAMPALALYQTELSRAVDQVIHGKAEPDAALQDVAAKVQKELDDFRKQTKA
jgi:multiple sugar transport system substrate-binding protein